MRRLRRNGPALLALLALALLPACGGDDGTPGGAPPASSPASTAASSTASPSSPGATPGAATLPPGCPSPAAPPAGARLIRATVRGGTVTSERATYDVPLGTPVRIEVVTDAADEVHVHGYDVRAETTPGCPAVLDFRAEIPGSVEVELERTHRRLFEVKSS